MPLHHLGEHWQYGYRAAVVSITQFKKPYAVQSPWPLIIVMEMAVLRMND